MLDMTELFVFVDDVCQQHQHTWAQEQKMLGDTRQLLWRPKRQLQHGLDQPFEGGPFD